MNRRRLFFIGLCALGLLIALFQFLAHAYFLYWAWWWADIVMHFLGGLFVSGFVLWWLAYEVPVGLRGKLPRFAIAFIMVLVVGVSWEVFEYVTGMYNELNYSLDTTTDLATDVLGMLVAYLLFKKLT